MKKSVISVVAGMLVLASTTAMAAVAGPGDNNIRYTLHNLSNDSLSYRVIKSSSEDQVCIFCHTPHNANPSRPLWNKVLPSQAFNMYTSSNTLTTTARKVTMPGPESLLCLSCHDGRTAVNVLHQTRNPAAVDVTGGKAVPMEGGMGDGTEDGDPFGIPGWSLGSLGFAGYGANLGKLNSDSADLDVTMYGGNLTDDHPISFSYTKAYADKTANNDLSLKDVDLAKSQGARFFGKDNRIECSSCHNPHVAYGPNKWDGNPALPGNPLFKPFLVRDNNGSALCLACHNK